MGARGSASRRWVDTRVSSMMDDARRGDQLQRTLEDAGWDVTRIVSSSQVAVVLERPSGIPGLVDTIRFSGLTAIDALREAVSWVLNEAVSE